MRRAKVYVLPSITATVPKSWGGEVVPAATTETYSSDCIAPSKSARSPSGNVDIWNIETMPHAYLLQQTPSSMASLDASMLAQVSAIALSRLL